MQMYWSALVPPLLVLILSITTRQVFLSLLTGIIYACLSLKNFNPIKATHLFVQRCSEQFIDPSNILTAAFLLLLGMLITLMNITGGASAYGNTLKKLLKSARSTKLSTIGLSLLFMIDDFFSSLTVGCIMRPLTDQFNIPRAKLAFLIDSLSAPLVIIMPISTWIAMLLMQLNKAGISSDITDKPIILADTFLTYLHAIPYVFYSFLTLLSVWLIVQFGISYGPMKHHEIIARTDGNLFGGRRPLYTACNEAAQGSIIDFAVPICSLLTFIIFSILYFGNSSLLGGTNNVLQTIQRADIYLALFIGALCTTILNITHMVLRKKISYKDTMRILVGMWDLMGSSIIMLFFTFVFSTLLKDDIKAGQYLAQLLTGAIPESLLPVLLFIVSFITSTATGSSWGTIAIIMPLAIPIVGSFFQVTTPTDPSAIPLLYPVIGAIFSGTVAGDHLSPISSTSVMSATSAGAYLSDHINTQFFYAIPSLLATCAAYAATGACMYMPAHVSFIISCATAIVVLGVSLFICNRFLQRKA